MTDQDPASQATPRRFDEDPGADDRTHYAPRQPAPALTGDEDATHYAPRTPAPPLAGSADDATPDAPRTPAPPRAGSADDATPDAPRTPAPPLAGSADDATHYSARPNAASPQHPGSGWTPTSLRDVPQATRPGSWAPSNWHLPEDRFAAPQEKPVRRRERPSAVKVLSWALAVVVTAVAAGVIYVNFIRTPPVDDAVKVPESSASVAQAKVLRGDEAVRGYLTALAEGDVATALSFGPTGGNGSQMLLTKASYANSVKAAPISNIDVPTTDANATEIPASYSVGDQVVNTSFRVTKQDNGSWLLEKTTATFRFQGTKVDNVPIRVNGVTVDWETPLELVPGTYLLSTGLPFIAFDAGDNLTMLNLNYNEVTVHNAAPALTDQGQQALVAAGRRTLQACASRKELRPANCPNSMTTTRAVDASTIKWELVGDPFAGVRPGLSATDQSRAETNMVVVFLFTVKLAGSTSWVNANEYRYNATVSADMTVSNASQIRPEWRS
ncbi:hypothetical protein [Aestuariimicrobium ganziense]|uniref:hypothetical protein n=1 Tax=Aestuariimicrobium ganziense TaxID=2773677 RepID=UPI0019435E2C|nr:hypothetical protein [Aestuariimicrobium ganziense]